MAEHRKEKGLRAFRAMSHFLTNTNVPLKMRITVLKAVLHPCLVYGGEVWGANRARCKPVQKVVDMALRAVLTGSCTAYPDGVTCMGKLAREVNVTPVFEHTSAAMLRLTHKYAVDPVLNTRSLFGPYATRTRFIPYEVGIVRDSVREIRPFRGDSFHFRSSVPV